jgi:hypothetical protein
MSQSAEQSLADDTMEGAREIARFMGKTLRQTNYLLEIGKLPAFKLGGHWHMRKSTYLSYIERLEAAAVNSA